MTRDEAIKLIVNKIEGGYQPGDEMSNLLTANCILEALLAAGMSPPPLPKYSATDRAASPYGWEASDEATDS